MAINDKYFDAAKMFYFSSCTTKKFGAAVFFPGAQPTASINKNPAVARESRPYHIVLSDPRYI